VNAVNRLLVALALACNVVAAQASLGGNRTSVELDRIQMKVEQGARLTLSSAGYTVHETTLPAGTLVRQYVSTAGLVFAVTWSGPFKPDLRQLLGPHFDMMISRQAGHIHAGHPFINQQESDLVIESGGHPRSFVGRAYLPNALPAGVTAEKIQ
jgi:hypothetical protein